MRAAVIIPARNAASLLPECLASIAPQLGPDDELIVVDDASEDATADIAAAHGAVVRSTTSRDGPYAARERGWRSSDADLMLFTDSRCRARPGWLDVMRRPFRSDDVALTCADLQVLPGPTVAARVMYHRQSYRTRPLVERPYFLPYFVTANLGVRRTALEAVDGFRPIRSGGDADLCWRIQIAGQGRLVAIEQVTMDWVPRDGVRSLLAQWARYGRSRAQLCWEYRHHGACVRPPTFASRIHHAARTVGIDLIRRRTPPDVAALDGLATWIHEREIARTLRRVRTTRSA